MDTTQRHHGVRNRWRRGWAVSGLALALLSSPAAVAGRQHHHGMHHAPARDDGWSVMSMAQLFPVLTAADPFRAGSPLRGREVYLTQPALMVEVRSPGGELSLRTTLDFEQLTQPHGEYTFGGWGEGFIDKRHPHTLLHELMLTWSTRVAPGGSASLSLGKGFAPYGTEDPMGRPAVKFPTNHHLSQILERWVVSGAYEHASGWVAEAGVFGGAEPEDAYDLSNIGSFGDSWSARLTRRLGRGSASPPWEVSASFARVAEEHGGHAEITRLVNGALRYAAPAAFGHLYGLLEASRSDPEEGDGFWAVLGEAQLTRGRHAPYARVEWSTRPEYHREGAPGSEGFYRYDHGTHVDGATRWLITTVGYGYDGSQAAQPVSVRPFVELQHHRVRGERGAVDPVGLYGARQLWSLSVGLRLFLGGGPMHMGSYGVGDRASGAERPHVHPAQGSTPAHPA